MERQIVATQLRVAGEAAGRGARAAISKRENSVVRRCLQGLSDHELIASGGFQSADSLEEVRSPDSGGPDLDVHRDDLPVAGMHSLLVDLGHPGVDQYPHAQALELLVRRRGRAGGGRAGGTSMASICSPAVIDSASSFRLRPGRDEDLAPGAAGAADLSVQRHKGTIERFGQCNVPSVVTGQVVPQRPYALGKRHERKQLKVKPKQVSVSAVGLESRDFAGSFQPPQNVARLGQRQLRTGRRILGERGFRPSPLSPRVDQNRDKHGCIDDDRHVRSASRARRMLDGRTRVPAASLRLRTPCSHASMEGREAIRSNSQRRNSCMDWRCNAARAASSSRTSSGTPLMVI